MVSVWRMLSPSQSGRYAVRRLRCSQVHSRPASKSRLTPDLTHELSYLQCSPSEQSYKSGTAPQLAYWVVLLATFAAWFFVPRGSGARGNPLSASYLPGAET